MKYYDYTRLTHSSIDALKSSKLDVNLYTNCELNLKNSDTTVDLVSDLNVGGKEETITRTRLQAHGRSPPTHPRTGPATAAATSTARRACRGAIAAGPGAASAALAAAVTDDFVWVLIDFHIHSPR